MCLKLFLGDVLISIAIVILKFILILANPEVEVQQLMDFHLLVDANRLEGYTTLIDFLDVSGISSAAATKCVVNSCEASG
jgi:hypothetical protein